MLLFFLEKYERPLVFQIKLPTVNCFKLYAKDEFNEIHICY